MDINTVELERILASSVNGDVSRLVIESGKVGPSVVDAKDEDVEEEKELTEEQKLVQLEGKRHKLLTMYLKDKSIFEDFGIKSIKEIQSMESEGITKIDELVDLKIFSHAHNTILNKCYRVIIEKVSKMFGKEVNMEELFDDEEFSRSVTFSPIGNYLFRFSPVVKSVILQVVSVLRYLKQ